MSLHEIIFTGTSNIIHATKIFVSFCCFPSTCSRLLLWLSVVRDEHIIPLEVAALSQYYFFISFAINRAAKFPQESAGKKNWS